MKGFAGAVAFAVTVAATSYVSYRLMTDRELRTKLVAKARSVLSTTKQTVDGMSEEVALRTAQMTRNPKINQQWVAQQWESVGY